MHLLTLQPADQEMSTATLSSDQLKKLVQDAAEAIERLLSLDEGAEVFSSDTREDRKFEATAAKLMSRIREVTMRYRNNGEGSHPSRSMDERTIHTLEDALWAAYGLTGEVVPDELLKECQRRVREALPGSRTEMIMKEELDILDAIHRYRKSRSTEEFFRRRPTGLWAKAQAVRPSPEMRLKGPHFWALIIGNNSYPRAPLGGCINDATLLRRHLIDYVGVPSDHIAFLTDASRQSMTTAFYDLRDNNRIEKGDNILIHFSGHGSSYDAREYFMAQPSKAGSIEALCPVDRGASVPDISDRELNLILSEIRAEKGPNITVILDCCHSAGAVRSLITTDTVRFIPPLRAGIQALDLQKMLEAADENPRRRLSSPLATTENWEADVSSFVTLAACHDFQLAEEFNTDSLDSPVSHASKPLDEPTDYTDSLDSPFSHTSKPLDEPTDSPVVGFRPRGLMLPQVSGINNKKLYRKGSPRYGRFTWALVKVLQSELAKEATYESIISSIGSLGRLQQPVVVGSRKTSRLWFDK